MYSDMYNENHKPKHFIINLLFFFLYFMYVYDLNNYITYKSNGHVDCGLFFKIWMKIDDE